MLYVSSANVSFDVNYEANENGMIGMTLLGCVILRK